MIKGGWAKIDKKPLLLLFTNNPGEIILPFAFIELDFNSKNGINFFNIALERTLRYIVIFISKLLLLQ